MTDLTMMMQDVLTHEKETIQQQQNEQAAKFKQQLTTLQKQADETLAAAKTKIDRENDQALTLWQRRLQGQQRQKLLQVKQDLLQQVFAKALTALYDLSTADFMRLLNTALSKLELTQAIEVQLGAKSRAQFDAAQFKQNFSEKNQVTLQNHDIEDEGGFILHSGTVDYNYLFSNLIATQKKRLLPALAAQLFVQK